VKDRPPIQRGSPSMRRAREPESRRAAIDGNVAVGAFAGVEDHGPRSSPMASPSKDAAKHRCRSGTDIRRKAEELD
jgi:hypothetical protein